MTKVSQLGLGGGLELASPSGSPAPTPSRNSGTRGWSSMNETAVAKSYMNHEKPQSSKSITRTVGPSTSTLARRMSACTSPKRAGC